MFGPTLKHKVLSSVLFCLAAAVFVSVLLRIYQHGAVAFDAVSGLGGVLFLLSFALIPEVFFLNLSQAFKVRIKSNREKIAEKLLYSGMLLILINFVGELLL